MKNLIGWEKKPISFDFRYNPFLPLQQEIDKMANDFYKMFESSFSAGSLENLTINPSVDIVEDDENFKVEIEMPGMGEEDIKVSVNDQRLLIRGQKEKSKKDDGKNYLMKEIGYGNYERIIPLPDYLNINEAKATFKKGMLWISFPKKAGVGKQSHEIKIEKAAT